jgi:D-threo-aldose 1-dehydrogenase
MTLAPHRALGRTNVVVSRLGFGTAPIGNLYRAIDDRTAEGAVAAALRAGIDYFDTAPHYGLGLAEQRLGAALARSPDTVVSTKVGRLLEPNEAADPGDDLASAFAVPARWTRRWDFSRDGVLRSLDDSRRRLGRDRLDIVFIHDPDDHLDEALDAALPTLVELRQAGVVGAIGAGMNSAPLLTRFVDTGVVDVVLLAGRYTLLEQDALDDLFPAAIARGVSVVVGGVFNSGILTRDDDDVDADARYDYRRAPAHIVARVRRLAAACRDHGVPLPAAAVQFPFAHPAVASVVLGLASAEQVDQAVAWLDVPIPGDLWSDLMSEGLLRADAPAARDVQRGGPS